MQSVRPHPDTGRHYYFRPSKKGTGTPLMLTEETIRRHLAGEMTIGLYAINPSTQRCKWVAIDGDYRNAMEDLLKLQYHLTQDWVEPALDLSPANRPVYRGQFIHHFRSEKSGTGPFSRSHQQLTRWKNPPGKRCRNGHTPALRKFAG